MKIDYSNPKTITRSVLLLALVLSIVLSLLTGCSGTYYIVDQPDHDHSTEIYYHNDLPYWGFYNNYYYYYGIPHMYPWWYYYTLMPHNTYSVHTHVTIYCDNGYYVNKPRGPKFNNNRGGTYKPSTVVKSNRTNIRSNTNRTNIRTNTNRTNIKVNTNRTNVKVNTNRTNTNRTNINRSNNRVKINKINTNRSNNRKVNTKRPR